MDEGVVSKTGCAFFYVSRGTQINFEKMFKIVLT